MQKMKFLIWTNVQLLLYENMLFSLEKTDEFGIAIVTIYGFICVFQVISSSKQRI